MTSPTGSSSCGPRAWASIAARATRLSARHRLAALGATDQHSKVQLFMEGPPDKTVTFIAVTEGGVDLTIPKLHSDVKELGYLGGHRLGELLSIEQRATAGALARRGRPNMTIHVDRVDARHLGAS